MMEQLSAEPTSLVVAMEVIRTPQGTLVRSNDILLERSNSGRLQTWRPDSYQAGEGVEVVELREMEEEEEEEDDMLDPTLAEALADSGSEAEDPGEEFSLEELQEALQGENALHEEDHQPGGQGLDWSEDFSSFRGTPEEFHEDVGPKIEGTSPSGLFTQIWDQHLIEMMVKETNRYAWQTIAPLFESQDISQKSRLHQWHETSLREIYTLIAVMIYMGMCVRGRLSDYWSTDVMGMPKFRSVMSYDRFVLLLKFLHFADNDEIHERGEERKLAKILPVLNYLNIKFQSCYTPRREVSIDESLLLWKGDLSWVQCIRSKAARFGIKSYELCEAVTGFVLKVIIYTGKGTTASHPVYGFTSSTAKIVFALFKDYFGRGYVLFMDNFYNSIGLTRFLKRQKTDVVGTLNRRRIDCPPEIKQINDKRMPRGAVVSRHCGDVSVVAWKDVKLVTTVSTYHGDHMLPCTRASASCVKPASIHTYNQFMGGVDLKDQILSQYLLERKRGIKWYIKVFRRLLNISILNSYIIYRANMGQHKKLTHRQFRKQLAEELCAQFGSNVSTRSRPGNSCARLDRSLDHCPEQCEVAEERTARQVRYKRGRCVRCAALKTQKKTNIMCRQCQVFLCVGSCWHDFHNLESL